MRFASAGEQFRQTGSMPRQQISTARSISTRSLQDHARSPPESKNGPLWNRPWHFPNLNDFLFKN